MNKHGVNPGVIEADSVAQLNQQRAAAFKVLAVVSFDLRQLPLQRVWDRINRGLHLVQQTRHG